MSLDPLSLLRQVAVKQGALTERRQPAASGNSFAETLNSLESQSNATEFSPATAKGAVQLAQLRMMQGLFLDDESESEDTPLASCNWQALAKSLHVTGQNVDRRYDKLQPTLLETGQHNGHSIDRLIDRVAGQVSLAPELIRSVVAAESDFRPDAVSPAGAQGLMQLMPETAREMGVQDSFDPQQNLLAGSQYLKQLLDKYDGDLDHALAAYNWGQGNVDRKGLEQMPQETRDYLTRVKNGLEPARG